MPSFRFRVATDTLGLGYTLPATGRVRDSHPLDCARAGRTRKGPAELSAGPLYVIYSRTPDQLL